MNKTPSNEGSSSGISDVKYQKAIKEISKLISLNTALKKEHATLLQNYDKICLEYDSFKERMKPMGSIDFKDVSISTIEKTSPKEETKLISSKYQENESTLVGRNVEDLNNKMMEKQNIIESLNQKIDSLTKSNKELILKFSNAYHQTTKLTDFIPKKDFEALERENRKLREELSESIKSLQKVCQSYSELQYQLNDDIPSAKSLEQGQFRDPLSDFYIEQLKRVEQENIKLRKEANEKKIILKGEISKLREENEEKLGKLMYLTSFVEKQQHFISKFIISDKQSDK